MLRIFVDLQDDTGLLNVTWYNLRFLPKQLWQGRELLVAGTVEDNPLYHRQLPITQNKTTKQKPQLIAKHRLRSPVIEFISADDPTHTGRITPIYPETYGVTSRFLRYQVKNLLPLLSRIPEYIPGDIIKRHQLIDIHDAIRAIHFPNNTKELTLAQQRLRFDELFFLQLAALVRRQQRQQEPAIAIKATKQTINKFIDQLPFSLTSAQVKASQEILSDIRKTTPMNRLLQGDVGSGKSAVALIAAHTALTQQQKVLYLAPTEILARQQATSFTKALPGYDVDLLIGATKPSAKKAIKKQLAESQPLCVVGTHALLQDDIKVKNLSLVIVDEQHRFGVKQRKALQQWSQQEMPHLLSMTATPIPRTLNLTVYGDLDVSVLDTMPPGRQPIKTVIVTAKKKNEAVTHVLTELHAGRQAYVIAPLVEQSVKLQAKSAQETVKEMRSYFPDIAIELIHGRMPSAEKKAIMDNFNAGAIQLLVSTAVVEVGVDVPNATIMIIEGAERFGLAQLHQFRGRIGRGKYQSYCYLFPTSNEGTGNPRLNTLAGTTDGFAIAEADLKLRGPGEVYGTAQSGFAHLQVASLLDYDTIKLARSEAAKILQSDPELTNYPILKKKVEQKNQIAHFE